MSENFEKFIALIRKFQFENFMFPRTCSYFLYLGLMNIDWYMEGKHFRYLKIKKRKLDNQNITLWSPICPIELFSVSQYLNVTSFMNNPLNHSFSVRNSSVLYENELDWNLNQILIGFKKIQINIFLIALCFIVLKSKPDFFLSLHQFISSNCNFTSHQ